MPELTIIVPVYNGEKEIEKAITSLLDQSEKVNILVINDGSKDNTEAIVLKLKDQHDNIEYYFKENSGIASTRNFGVSKVTTEYFGFLDADDTVKSDMAEKMLKEIKNRQADICMSDFTWTYEDSTRKPARDVGYRNKHEILEKMFATLWNKIYRTEWFQNTGITFPDGLRYEDASLLYRLAYHMDKVCYVDEAFVDYFQRKGSITHTYNININDMIEVFKGIRLFYEDKDAYEEYKEEIEYLFIRFFLGNSYLRAVKIIDPKVRKETLDKGWNFLVSNYPDFNKNSYLKKGGMKNLYFKMMNKTFYYTNVHLFRILNKLTNKE